MTSLSKASYLASAIAGGASPWTILMQVHMNSSKSDDMTGVKHGVGARSYVKAGLGLKKGQGLEINLETKVIEHLVKSLLQQIGGIAI